MQLDGKVALVTGAGSGIGKATAALLASEGARVAVLSRTEAEVREVEAQIERDGGQSMAVVADVSKPEEMERAYREVADRWGRLDIVFANAGINGVWASIEELTPEDWDTTLAVNLKGTFLTIKYAVPYMKQRGGSIVVTSSVNGTRIFSNTGATAYSTSKAGQVALTKMLALELARYKIRVNVICPGAVKTDIDANTDQRNVNKLKEPVEYKDGSTIPLTRGEPAMASEIANIVLFLASDDSAYVTGTELWADGGTSLVVG